MFIVSVIVYCHILQFLHQMFNMSALLLDDALMPATPLTNGAINERVRQTLDISQDSVAIHWRCGGICLLEIFPDSDSEIILTRGSAIQRNRTTRYVS